MRISIIDRKSVLKHLSYEACIGLVEDALRAISAQKAVLPFRKFLDVPGTQAKFGWMPGFVELGEHKGALGAKLISIFPDIGSSGRSKHRGLVALFDPSEGSVLAVVEAEEITKIRTAAASAVATKHLSRTNVRTLTILGAGAQAESHLKAMLSVRSFERVKIWTRTPKRGGEFVEAMTKKYSVEFESSPSVKDAVSDADVICSTTSAKEPIFNFDWAPDGCHINLIGSGVPTASEISPDVASRSLFVVEHRETICNQAGEVRRAIEAGLISADRFFPELGDILLGRERGRTSEKEITVFKSIGLAAYDLAAATFAYERAMESGDATIADFE